MGTKLNPAPNDCYARALPDEPMFVLLARDPEAPAAVEAWAVRREAVALLRDGVLSEAERALVDEARACAHSMREWREANHPRWRGAEFVQGGEPVGPPILPRLALAAAARQFRSYAAQHRAKDTPEGKAKAVVNESFAAMCDRAMVSPDAYPHLPAAAVFDAALEPRINGPIQYVSAEATFSAGSSAARRLDAAEAHSSPSSSPSQGLEARPLPPGWEREASPVSTAKTRVRLAGTGITAGLVSDPRPGDLFGAWRTLPNGHVHRIAFGDSLDVVLEAAEVFAEDLRTLGAAP